jgi:lactoylglutathione lyase
MTRYLHTMIRVSDPDATIAFFGLIGLKETRRFASEQGRFTLIFLAPPGQEDAEIELTHNWDPAEYSGGRNFGHLAFVKSPDGISVELLQDGNLPPQEPWASMPNVGSW